MMRIVFNGQEYTSREAMPEDVRRAYDESLEILRKAYPDAAIPGAAGVSGDHTVVNVQRETSFSFKFPGEGGLPTSIRGLMGSARDTDPGPAGERGSEDSDPLQTSMGMLLAFVAGFVLVFGIALMFAIGGGRSQLPGRLAVAVMALLLLGWLDGMAGRLARRRESLLGPDTPGYRRFVVWSAAGLATAAVLLLGIAWYMP